MPTRSHLIPLLLAAPALAQPTIRSLGTLSGSPPNGGWTTGISSDGRTATGYGNARAQTSGMNVTLGAVARLSPSLQGDFASLPPLSSVNPFNTFGFAFAASDLSPANPIARLVGYSSNAQGLAHATVWEAGASATDYGNSDPSSASFMFDITPDSAAIAGSIGNSPCIWHPPQTTPSTLPRAGNAGGIAYAISADASVVAGTLFTTTPSRNTPARWVGAADPELLGTLIGAVDTRPVAISDDGSTIIGTAQNTPGASPYRGFLWSQLRGIIELGALQSSTPSCRPYCISADATLIGGVDESLTRRAVLWNRPHNPRELAAILTTLGTDLTGWNLTAIRGMSADGTIVTGAGTLNGVELSFLTTLPPHCAADYNLDYTVDLFDYLDYIADFAIASLDADINADGAVDLFDYLDFLQSFSGSC